MILTQEHSEKVRIISERFKSLFISGQKVRVYHGSTNSTRSVRLHVDNVINISNLDKVISINDEEMFVTVEPNVSMEKLVKETLRFGLLPPVMMEFPKITVGGAIQGTAGESSSFRYGLFHNICMEYEIVLGNGEILYCSRENNQD